MGNLAHEDNKDFLVRKVTKGQEDFPALQVQLGCRAYLDLLVKRGKLEMLVKWVLQVLLDPEVQEDPLELMGHKVQQVGLEILELLVKRENLEKQESLACPETLDHQVLKEREGKKVKQAPLGLLAPQAQKVPQEMMVPKGARVRLAFQVIQVLQVNLVQLVRMVQQVIKEMMVNLAKLVPLVQPESQALQAHQGREGHLDQQDLKAVKERKVPRVKQVWKDLLGKQVLLVLRDLQESQVLMDFGEYLAQWVSKGFQVRQAQMDLLAQWVRLVYLA